MENSFPWLDLAAIITPALIAVALGLQAWLQRATTRKIHQVYKVHDWGHACLHVLSECENLCSMTSSSYKIEDFDRQRNDVLIRLSSLISQGRLYYENVRKDEHGQEKFPANRGYRPVILDPLVAAYCILTDLDDLSSLPDSDRRLRLEKWRNFFLSLLQEDVLSKWFKRKTAYQPTMGGSPGYSVSQDSCPPSWEEYRDHQLQMRR